jgi:general secretion pathway protein F
MADDGCDANPAAMQFRAKVMSSSHAVAVRAVEASDEEDARWQLGRQGLQVIALSSARTWRRRQTGRIPLVTFSQELVALLEAGLTLVEAISTLSEKEANPGVRRSFEGIRARLLEGQTLSNALAAQPESFPPLYVAAVRASERTGAIREALVRYITYQKQVDHVRKSLVNASIYPAVLIVAGVLVMLFLVGYVVPRFSAIYQDLGRDLPWASRLLMEWGQLLQAHAFSAGVAFAALIGAAAYAVMRPRVRAMLGAGVARIPAIGRELRLYQLARMYRTIGMLLRGGIPMVTACQMSAGLLGAALRPAFAAATQGVREGQSIANAFERFQLTTPVAARMLRVGERSGNMGEMMERIAAFYDDELSQRVDLLVRLIEPLLMTAIGILIGVIVVLMYFPIFELAGSIQ